jgi:hypothetical protein
MLHTRVRHLRTIPKAQRLKTSKNCQISQFGIRHFRLFQ